ncbi:hypothetical protein BDZ89DRAFT_771113 [Hymenopellis radicata]|nr:hypothetical protein BDZ89DRAFT_771113 [Hymenopellis radicata]
MRQFNVLLPPSSSKTPRWNTTRFAAGSKFDSAAERLSLRLGTTISETWIPWMPSPGRRESGEKNDY